MIAFGCTTPCRRRQLGLGERQDHAPLDDLLRLVHAAQLVPEARVDHPAAELRDRAVRAAARERALVDPALGRRVSAPLEARAGREPRRRRAGRHGRPARSRPPRRGASASRPRRRRRRRPSRCRPPPRPRRSRRASRRSRRRPRPCPRSRATASAARSCPSPSADALDERERRREITGLVGANRGFHPRTILGRATRRRSSRSRIAFRYPDYPGTTMNVILPDGTELELPTAPPASTPRARSGRSSPSRRCSSRPTACRRICGCRSRTAPSCRS